MTGGPALDEVVDIGVEGDFCWLLFRLAGRIPDEPLTIMRTCLGDGDLPDAVDVLASALAHDRPALTEEEAEVAGLLLEDAGFAPDVAAGADRIDRLPPTGFRFAPPPSGLADDRLVRAVVSAGAAVGGLRAVWRTCRGSAAGTLGVWLVEADEHSDAIELTAEIQHRLALAGEVPPQVEVLFPDEGLPPYHEAAVAGGALVWVRDDLPPPRVARCYDGADAAGTPYFEPGRPRLTGGDRDRVLGHLLAADVLLAGYAHGDDVVDPTVTGTVPHGLRSDGRWVWTDSVAYYLERYGLAPEPELLGHIRAAAGPPGPLRRLQAHQALALITVPPAGVAPLPG